MKHICKDYQKDTHYDCDHQEAYNREAQNKTKNGRYKHADKQKGHRLILNLLKLTFYWRYVLVDFVHELYKVLLLDIVCFAELSLYVHIFRKFKLALVFFIFYNEVLDSVLAEVIFIRWYIDFL